jgi:toxin FitB
MIILDTNVLSELMKQKPSARVTAWVRKQPSTELFTTSITEAEIFYGIELLPQSKRREGLLEAAEAMFAEDLAGRIFGFESDAARFFAKIAAIAQMRGARLATRNIADFTDCGIEVVDPWNGL